MILWITVILGCTTFNILLGLVCVAILNVSMYQQDE